MQIIKKEKVNFKKIVKAIKQRKVIVCPTDTVYGLIVDATNKKVVERVFKIKKRPQRKPIPIFVRDIKMAKKLAEINKKQEKFLKKVWPGKITVVLEKNHLRAIFTSALSRQGKTIAMRIPKYKLVNILLQKLNLPLTGTSGNISRKPASTKIKEVINQFKNQKYQPDLIIDVGNLPKSKPSKVLDLTTSPPKVLRI